MLANVRPGRMPAELNRVLLTADAVGGVWQYALDLARSYRARAIDVDLVVLGPEPGSARMAEAAAVPGLSVISSELPLEWMAEDAAVVEEAAQALTTLAEALEPDVVHLNNPALACRSRLPCPLVVTLHSCMASWWKTVRGEEPMPEDFAWRMRLIHDGLKAADAAIVPSEAFAALARQIYPGVDFRVIHNGRNGTAPKLAEQARHGVFTSGRLWDEAKNARALDRAAKKLGIPINAAGAMTAPDGSEIALNHLRLLGELPNEEVKHWLRTSEIYVSVALYEPFGLGVLEAAQAGCPLILSDIPTFRELWDGAALFVPPRDLDMLAGALANLAGDDQRRRALGAEAADRAKLYTAGAMAAATLQVYNAALQRSTVLGIGAE